MNNGKQGEQLLKVLDGHSASLDRTSKMQRAKCTGCFLRPDIKRFCLTFTIGPERIWFCLILVSDFFLQ